MSSDTQQTRERALFIANRIVRASAKEWPNYFESLRQRRYLSTTVHQLNRWLDEPAHRDLAKSALKRLGLEHGG